MNRRGETDHSFHLYDLIEPHDTAAVAREAVEPLAAIDEAFPAERVRAIYRDVIDLFQGRFPGYRASDAWYHDLEHTSTVFFCTAAMLQGAHYEGEPITNRGRLLVLAAALFHDVGLIRRVDENGGTGARFTIGHEARSVEFLESYFDTHGFSQADREDGRSIIQCTVLNNRIEDIAFRTAEARRLGQILGSADIIAQMADRAYLEKLLLLYREFREAGIPGYSSELELLEKTPDFYNKLVKRRLACDFDGADRLLDAYARVRWGIDKNPFQHSIEQNLDYLQHILQNDKARYRRWLRREGIADALDPDPEQ